MGDIIFWLFSLGLWFSCSKNTFKLFGFPIFWLRTLPINVIPETHRTHKLDFYILVATAKHLAHSVMIGLINNITSLLIMYWCDERKKTTWPFPFICYLNESDGSFFRWNINIRFDHEWYFWPYFSWPHSEYDFYILHWRFVIIQTSINVKVVTLMYTYC